MGEISLFPYYIGKIFPLCISSVPSSKKASDIFSVSETFCYILNFYRLNNTLLCFAV